MPRHPELKKLLRPRYPVKEIADACGVSRQAVSQWRTVPVEHAATVAATLGVPVSIIPTTPNRSAERDRDACCIT